VHPVAGTKDARLNATVGYDAIASTYDDQVRGDDWMRRQLHAHFLRAFRPGDRILDVGCGTGIDAVALAQKDIHVLGVDASSAMIAQLQQRAAAGQLSDSVEARVLRIQDLGSLQPLIFDGIIASFASLSAVPDLSGFAEDAARLVPPGGRMILHLLNRFSVWEFLGYLARRDWASARQVGRLTSRRFVIGGQSVDHSLYFADEAYRRFFASRFELRDAYCLGTLRPPHTVRRIPTPIVVGLEWLDVRLGRLPLLRNAGRFFVLDLQRRPT
jgi:2-polyprenyl-3-methyl-5-hydroxy-6-metoxy-1,4-benzoquinol methylase